MISIIKKLKSLSSLNLFFWSTLWLMIILTIGTVDQKNIGLFESQKKYFTSLYFLYKDIPIPSGGFVLFIMMLGLLSQIFFKTSFLKKRTMGVAITHLGALLLLSGAFLTRFNAEEGSLIIPEGETVNFMQDYKKYEFVLRNTADKNETFVIPFDEIKSGPKMHFFKADAIQFTKVLANCELKPRTTLLPSAKGFISQFDFTELPVSAENIRCIEFSLYNDGTNESSKSTYGIFQDMPKEQTVIIGNKTFIAEIRNLRIRLPFSIKLIDFEKKFHQGTMLSKSFKSEVHIIDNNRETRHVIEMNAPLRYKGYTFYQSSFSENANGEITELSVVKNAGQVFPYIASLIICFGLLIHLLLNSKKLFKSDT